MMTPSGCCEVWETRSVFQGAVVKSKTCPWPRHLSAAGGSKREFKQLSVSKSLTRSVWPDLQFPSVLPTFNCCNCRRESDAHLMVKGQLFITVHHRLSILSFTKKNGTGD